jgi:histidinol dehydrogenase
MRIVKLTEETKKDIMGTLLKRSPDNYGDFEATVKEIVADVHQNKDEALFRYTEKFDHAKLDKDSVRVSEAEIEEAYKSVPEELLSVMRKAITNIRSYHEKQKTRSWFDTDPAGIMLGQKVTPLGIAGVYVPGGKAAYPSSVLMNVIPAKVAGVERIIIATPPKSEGKAAAGTIVAADIAGADEIYKVGGAQAIAAMAYGTETIPRVDKITGPGNIFVALAKKACFGVTGIDSVAGPSEILVIADSTANPRYVAADLLSQAEHDPMASAILLTDDPKLADAVAEEIDRFIEELPRREIICQSIENYGFIFVGDTIDDLIDAANTIASEHLEIMTANPFEIMPRIRNAGAIFLGNYSSEPLGDYFAGPNHILPTNGTARFFSPLGVDAFVKKSSIISYSRDALYSVHRDIEIFAENEGLYAHANSIRVRFEEE